MTRTRLAVLGIELIVGLMLITSVLAGLIVLSSGGDESGQLEQYAADTAAIMADPVVYSSPEQQTAVLQTLPADVEYYVVFPERTIGAPPPEQQATVTATRTHPNGSIQVTVWET